MKSALERMVEEAKQQFALRLAGLFLFAVALIFAIAAGAQSSGPASCPPTPTATPTPRCQICPPGPPGPAGKNGKDGKDGVGLPGPAGPAGKDGAGVECACTRLYPTLLEADWVYDPADQPSAQPCDAGFVRNTCLKANPGCALFPGGAWIRSFTVSVEGDWPATRTYIGKIYLVATMQMAAELDPAHDIVLHKQTFGLGGNQGHVVNIQLPGQGVLIPSGAYVYPAVFMGGLCARGGLRVDAVLYTDRSDAVVPILQGVAVQSGRS